MIKKIAIGVVLLSLILITVACSASSSAQQSPSQRPASTTTAPDFAPAPKVNPTPPPLQPTTPKPSGPIKAKWIEPEISGDTVSILRSEVEGNWNVHFKMQLQDGTENFMAYLYDGKIYVRANVCPPCRSIGFSLDNDIIVCDTCKTQFRAKDGSGIKGACVAYPKAAVQYKVVNANIVMNIADLNNAYQDTLKAG